MQHHTEGPDEVWLILTFEEMQALHGYLDNQTLERGGQLRDVADTLGLVFHEMRRMREA